MMDLCRSMHVLDISWNGQIESASLPGFYSTWRAFSTLAPLQVAANELVRRSKGVWPTGLLNAHASMLRENSKGVENVQYIFMRSRGEELLERYHI